MDYRILGPLEVSVGDRPLVLGGEKQRALLAVLLLHAGEVVSADRLIDKLWGDRAPPGAPKTLQAHISRLRKALDTNEAGPPEANGERSGGSVGGMLVTQGHGYLLRVEPGELDLERFQAVLEAGRRELASGDPERAADMLRAGLELWRGPALADFAYEAFAQAPIAQLEELRLGAVEDRVEADLALRRHQQLVGELTALVKQNPLRERMRTQLMLALYRCGRQAEALDVYQEYRRALAEELGLDPSPRLQQLEAAILARDPSLDGPAAGPAAAAPAVRARARRRLARGRAGLGVSVIVGIAAAVVALVSQQSGTSPSVIAADSVGAISAAGGVVTADVPVGSSPSSVAAGDGAVWVTNYNAGTVSRIDPATHAVKETIPAVSTPSAIAVGAGSVWVANTWSGTVSWINPTVNRVVETIPVGNGPSGIAVGDGSVWVANSSDGTLTRIDAVTGDVRQTIPLGEGATNVAVAPGAVWVTDEANGRVLRVDPQSGQVTQPISVGTGPTAIAVGFRSVWVTNSLDGTVSRIDPQTNLVQATIPVGNGPNAIAAGAGGVWVANEFSGTVSRIDPATNQAVTIRVGSRPQGVAVADGLVWVGAQASDTAHRGGTLTVLSSGPVSPNGSLDPALTYTLLIPLTNDGLTAFKRVGGSDGAQLVPDLAVSLPAPSNGGRSYTFRLRRGIRYSDGAPVRPEDFRRAIERDFKLRDPDAVAFYRNLVGGAACVTHPARCDLSRGIVVDDSAGTVTFHLVTADPELPYWLAVWDAVAVPAGTPNHDVGQHPIPATGAYDVASVTAKQVRLVRNPYFHQWSRASRPDGYPDQIVFKFGASPAAELTAIERGTADYTIDGPPADRLTEVKTRFASQLHINPSDVVDTLVLNTRVAPFNDPRVRQALNYAVDRAKTASLVGPDAQPTCQFLPRYIPGYQPYCPYTLDPTRTGRWTAPDLATAERLIAASHTRGTAITLWNTGGVYGDATGVGRYVVSLLNQLGYKATLRNLTSDPTAARAFADSRTKAQLALVSYFAAYPAASQYIQWSLSCKTFLPNSTNNPNLPEFCDPRLEHQINSALAAEEANSPAAADIWAQADKTVTDDAPLVPLDVPNTTDFVSRRAGNYQYSPELGGLVLIDQLWVR